MIGVSSENNLGKGQIFTTTDISLEQVQVRSVSIVRNHAYDLVPDARGRKG